MLFGGEARDKELEAKYALRCLAHVRKIAGLIAFLACPRSSYTAGTVLTADGSIASRHSIV